MACPDLGNIGTVSNGETWTEVVALYDDDTGDPFDLTSIVEITIKVRQRDGTAELNGTYTDLTITVPSDGVVSWVFTVDQMRVLDPGEYELGVVAEFSAETIELFTARKSIVDRIID